jgi:hypothetical protein
MSGGVALEIATGGIRHPSTVSLVPTTALSGKGRNTERPASSCSRNRLRLVMWRKARNEYKRETENTIDTCFDVCHDCLLYISEWKTCGRPIRRYIKENYGGFRDSDCKAHVAEFSEMLGCPKPYTGCPQYPSYFDLASCGDVEPNPGPPESPNPWLEAGMCECWDGDECRIIAGFGVDSNPDVPPLLCWSDESLSMLFTMVMTFLGVLAVLCIYTCKQSRVLGVLLTWFCMCMAYGLISSLLLIGGIEPNPGPGPRSSDDARVDKCEKKDFTGSGNTKPETANRGKNGNKRRSEPRDDRANRKKLSTSAQRKQRSPRPSKTAAAPGSEPAPQATPSPPAKAAASAPAIMFGCFEPEVSRKIPLKEPIVDFGDGNFLQSVRVVPDAAPDQDANWDAVDAWCEEAQQQAQLKAPLAPEPPSVPQAVEPYLPTDPYGDGDAEISRQMEPRAKNDWKWKELRPARGWREKLAVGLTDAEFYWNHDWEYVARMDVPCEGRDRRHGSYVGIKARYRSDIHVWRYRRIRAEDNKLEMPDTRDERHWTKKLLARVLPLPQGSSPLLNEPREMHVSMALASHVMNANVTNPKSIKDMLEKAQKVMNEMAPMFGIAVDLAAADYYIFRDTLMFIWHKLLMNRSLAFPEQRVGFPDAIVEDAHLATAQTKSNYQNFQKSRVVLNGLSTVLQATFVLVLVLSLLCLPVVMWKGSAFHTLTHLIPFLQWMAFVSALVSVLLLIIFRSSLSFGSMLTAICVVTLPLFLAEWMCLLSPGWLVVPIRAVASLLSKSLATSFLQTRG